MRFSLKKIMPHLILVLFSGFVMVMIPGCPLWGSPVFDMVVDNQTTQVLSIHIDDGYKETNDSSGVKVKPGEKITERWPMDMQKFNIVAKNSSGDIIYSKVYSIGELEELKYTITIK
jgi:hypothetical protein